MAEVTYQEPIVLKRIGAYIHPGVQFWEPDYTVRGVYQDKLYRDSEHPIELGPETPFVIKVPKEKWDLIQGMIFLLAVEQGVMVPAAPVEG